MARARVPGWWYPWIFVGGLVIVIAVNAVMMTLAIGTFPGLETEDAYRKGIEYNQTIAAARAQDARGWHLDLHFTQSPEAGVHGGDVSIAFVDRDGQALRELEVKVDFVRPLGEGIDDPLPFDERGGGVYGARFIAPLPGQWDARILARRGNETFQATRRIVIP